jgi:quinol monooxygenase YgiN
MTTQDPPPFALVVRFALREGAESAFDQLTATTTAAIRDREPGTLVYACHRVDGEPRQRVFYELYADRAAFDAHEAQPHVRQFLAAREELLDGFTVDFLTLADGKTPLPGNPA